MKMRIPLGAALLTVLMAASASATTLVRMSLDQLAEASTEIIRGHVVAQQSLWNPQHSRIYTYTTLALEEAYKGSPQSTVVVQQPGGKIAKIHLVVAGTVQFHPQAAYILFLERSPADSSKFLLVGMMQGAYRIYHDAKTQEEKLVLPFGSLARGTPASGAHSIISGAALSPREFRQDVASALNDPLKVPQGTTIPIVVKTAQFTGVRQMDLKARTTADLFPSPALVIPAGSSVSGQAERVGDSWKISWTQVSIRGRQVLLSAHNSEPARELQPGRLLVLNVR